MRAIPDPLRERIQAAIYADTSNPRQLSIGLIGGDIPVFPPLAVLLTTICALAAWRVTGRRYRFLPSFLKPVSVRIVFVAIGFGAGFSVVRACTDELGRVGTVPNFSTVSQVAHEGPFAWTRNGMYTSIFILQASLSIGLDTAWPLAAMAAMMAYFDRIVVPAEERFLTQELGNDYEAYCKSVPRWLWFS